MKKDEVSSSVFWDLVTMMLKTSPERKKLNCTKICFQNILFSITLESKLKLIKCIISWDHKNFWLFFFFWAMSVTFDYFSAETRQTFFWCVNCRKLKMKNAKILAILTRICTGFFEALLASFYEFVPVDGTSGDLQKMFFS